MVAALVTVRRPVRSPRQLQGRLKRLLLHNHLAVRPRSRLGRSLRHRRHRLENRHLPILLRRPELALMSMLAAFT